MATLKQTKKKFTSAINAAKITVLAIEDDRILIDLNGDKTADAALVDTTGNGAPDLLALDLTGDGKFNLFLDDTNDNNFPHPLLQLLQSTLTYSNLLSSLTHSASRVLSGSR